MQHHVGAELRRREHHRSEGVVDDEQHAFLVRHRAQRWHIGDGQSGVGYGLHVQYLGVTDADRIANLVDVGDIDEGGADRAGSGEEMGEEGVGAAVEAAGGNDVGSGGAELEKGGGDGGHTAGGAVRRLGGL